MGKHTDVNQRTRRKKTEKEKQETARRKALQAETVRVAAQEAEQEARRQFFGTDRTGSAEQAESSTAAVPPLPPQPAQSHSSASPPPRPAPPPPPPPRPAPPPPPPPPRAEVRPADVTFTSHEEQLDADSNGSVMTQYTRSIMIRLRTETSKEFSAERDGAKWLLPKLEENGWWLRAKHASFDLFTHVKDAFFEVDPLYPDLY